MLSQQIFYVIERIGDLFNLGIEFGNNDTKALIERLQRGLQRLREYVADRENREQLEKKFSLGIEALLENADHILDNLSIDEIPPNDRVENIQIVYSTNCNSTISPLRRSNSTDCDIKDLLKKIEGYFTSSSAHIYNFNTGNNQNFGGQQIAGPINLRIDQSSPPSVRQVPGRVTYGHLPNRDLVDFHTEIETLLQHVIQNDQPRVVGIVGMGGSGKTTLAKHLYHHDDINSRFAHKVWICVSQRWDEIDIKYEILRQTQGESIERGVIEKWSNQEFAEKLYKILSTQTYLIILDDIWDVDAWNSISPATPPPGKGSKIVVTSRNEDVAKRLDPAIVLLRPKPLNDEESYELFCKRTFTDEELLSSKQLLNLGKEIVSNCDGLPLAITVLAGALGANKSLNHWQFMSQSLNKSLTNKGDSTVYSVVREVLALSYHDLPYSLKRCFLYLAIFPEDSLIRTGRLKKMWMAECLITHDQLSDEYLDQLAQRYLIQDVVRSHMGRVKVFQMHDLIRDMCVEKAKEQGFLKQSLHISWDVGRATCQQGRLLCQDTIDCILRNSSRACTLRTALCLYPSDLNQRVSKLKCLRVLILQGTYVEVPEAIGNLVHLRYLGLDAIKVKLPDSIGNLLNLWILDIGMRLPLLSDEMLNRHREFMGLARTTRMNLCKLKHVKYLSLSSSPHGVGQQELKLDELKNLETLCIEGGRWMLSEMAGLTPNLHKLHVFLIPSQKHLNAVYKCPSIRLDTLQTLTLEWIDTEAEVEALKQCKSLRKLRLSGNIQESNRRPLLLFPPNLVYLEILRSHLIATDPLAVIGDSLPCLKVLILGRDSYRGTEMTCNAGSFPLLEKLEFRDLVNIKLLTIEKAAMPNLKDFTFSRCVCLDEFEVLGLPNLKLQHVNIEFLSYQIEEWGKKHRGIIWRSNCEFELPNTQDPCLNLGKRVKLIDSVRLLGKRKNAAYDNLWEPISRPKRLGWVR